MPTGKPIRLYPELYGLKKDKRSNKLNKINEDTISLEPIDYTGSVFIHVFRDLEGRERQSIIHNLPDNISLEKWLLSVIESIVHDSAVKETN